MTPQVHILATCRNPALIDATTLVFKTLRIGFPTANISVRANGFFPDLETNAQLIEATSRLWVGFALEKNPITHGQWITELIEKNNEPFWICDTDIIFRSSVESWFNESSRCLFAGRYEPEFFDPWTETRHVARIHPSLMWFNPVPLREAMAKWPGKHPFLDTVEKNLIRWHWVPHATRRTELYDTCAGLHQAFGGVPFTEEQNRAYDHLFAGTYSDLLNNLGIQYTHKLVMSGNQVIIDSLAEIQNRWYAEHAMKD